MKIRCISTVLLLLTLTSLLLGVKALHVNAGSSVKCLNSGETTSRCKPQLPTSDGAVLAVSAGSGISQRSLLTAETLGPSLASLNGGGNSPNKKSKLSASGWHSRKKRALRLDSFNNSDVRKVLELVVVADAAHVSAYGGPSNDSARIQQIVNYLNGVYQQFGLRIVLTKIVTLANSTFNLNQSSRGLMQDFGVYKIFNLDVRHDAAVLLITTLMKNDISSGLPASSPLVAWTSGLCRTFQSTAAVSDVGEPMQAAWFMAHTIGFLLGFDNVEDVPGCSCPAPNGCVMSSSMDSTYSTKLVSWDTCSINNWSSQADAIWRSCLKDAPNASYPYSAATQCGNGIVDSGEQCDCGPALTCKSACCDPITCTFKAGAECASGSCCNSTTCRLKSRGQVCRDTDGLCDVAETCDGATEWCPSDDRVSDGVVCAPNSAFCYNGECKSRDSQCKVLFDASATEASATCFTYINCQTTFGFCQTILTAANATNLHYSLVRCTNANAMCGLLHCTMPVKPTVGDTFTVGASTCSSQWSIDFASSRIRSPSMVPDGAACGTNLMCVNSSCEQVSKYVCSDCPDCHGNGVTTRGKLCYCKPGFAPPDCSSAGCGGSLTSPMVCDGSSATTKYVVATTTLVAASTSLVIGVLPMTTVIILIVVPVSVIALVAIVAVVIVKNRPPKPPRENDYVTGVITPAENTQEDNNSVGSCPSTEYDYPQDTQAE